MATTLSPSATRRPMTSRRSLTLYSLMPPPCELGRQAGEDRGVLRAGQGVEVGGRVLQAHLLGGDLLRPLRMALAGVHRGFAPSIACRSRSGGSSSMISASTTSSSVSCWRGTESRTLLPARAFSGDPVAPPVPPPASSGGEARRPLADCRRPVPLGSLPAATMRSQPHTPSSSNVATASPALSTPDSSRGGSGWCRRTRGLQGADRPAACPGST